MFFLCLQMIYSKLCNDFSKPYLHLQRIMTKRFPVSEDDSKISSFTVLALFLFNGEICFSVKTIREVSTTFNERTFIFLPY